jgi:hypothetical protein
MQLNNIQKVLIVPNNNPIKGKSPVDKTNTYLQYRKKLRFNMWRRF